MKFVVVAIALAGLVAPAMAQSNCEARTSFSPSLDKSVLKGATFSVVTTQTTGRGGVGTRESAIETAKLPGGIELVVGLRGCETHTNVYSFTLPKDAHADGDAPYWLARAADLLTLLHPANLDRKVKLDRLAAAMRQRAVGARFADGEFAGKGDGLGYTLSLIRESDGAVSLDISVTADS